MKILKKLSTLSVFVVLAILVTTTGNTTDYFDSVGKVLDKRTRASSNDGSSSLNLARYRPPQRYF